MEETYDFSGFVCPLSKIKAAQVVENIAEGDKAIIILGDAESLKSVAQDMKAKGITPSFVEESPSRYVLTITG